MNKYFLVLVLILSCSLVMAQDIMGKRLDQNNNTYILMSLQEAPLYIMVQTPTGIVVYTQPIPTDTYNERHRETRYRYHSTPWCYPLPRTQNEWFYGNSNNHNNRGSRHNYRRGPDGKRAGNRHNSYNGNSPHGKRAQ